MSLILLLSHRPLAANELISPQLKKTILEKEWQAKQQIHHPVGRPKSVNDEKTVKKISICVSSLPLTQVLAAAGRIFGFYAVLGPKAIDKTVSIDVHEMDKEGFLNTLLYPLDYGYRMDGGALTVLAEQTQVFRILLPPLEAGFNNVTSNESFVNSADADNKSGNNTQQVKVGTKVLVSTQSSGISFWDDIQSNLKALGSAKARITVNKPAGMVIVTDAPNNLKAMQRYFEELNARISAQIEVDVKVVEVTLNEENRYGVDWNVLAGDLKGLNSLGWGSNFASNNFTNGNFLTFNMDGSKQGSGLSENGFKLAIDALSKQGKVEVVSQPRVRILNNQVAVIQVGTTQSYVDRSTFETTQTGTVTSVSTSQVQEGVTMRLLANIVGDDIFLSVTPVVTSIDKIRSIISGNTTIEAPQTTTKSIDTLVKLTQGQTVAIGGLITSNKENSRQGVPLISKVPLLGRLFEYQVHQDNKRELIIFITPRKG